MVTGWTRICAESGTCLIQTTRCMVSLQAPITCVPALLASVKQQPEWSSLSCAILCLLTAS
ncbi:hypothetical protein CN138_30370 [Sinorhizobium meliloti]|nr:hypothetical protein [Sinorhizobium meliloti]RVE81582.1 hypothetical protein CN238_29570 [Sinorhizobium meliloti]RVE86896.1 hypothetical protein CN235_28355 [Sinorhizobium meliloti]RVG62264.1 hypothetical protein CN220_29320 [Sinorhizobium meliloti]RVH15774.1 hypothetical protein CN215_33970 [Sinorhizobium meliloti]